MTFHTLLNKLFANKKVEYKMSIIKEIEKLIYWYIPVVTFLVLKLLEEMKLTEIQAKSSEDTTHINIEETR